jgi:hypothetical protein
MGKFFFCKRRISQLFTIVTVPFEADALPAGASMKVMFIPKGDMASVNALAPFPEIETASRF